MKKPSIFCHLSIRLSLICLSMALFSGTLSLKAQIHVSGIKAVTAQLGLLDNVRLSGYDNRGYFLSLGYTAYQKNYAYWQAGLTLDRKNYLVSVSDRDFQAHTSRYMAEVLYNTLLWKDRKGSFYLSPGGGGFFGYESINGDNPVLSPGVELKAKSQFTYGLSGSLEAEYYLTQKMALSFQVRERWLIISDITHFHTYAGAGIKFIINP